jgi:hypothetical protein
MTITAEQFYKTVEGTPDANGLDIPKPVEAEQTQQEPIDNTPTPAKPVTPPAVPNNEPNPAAPAAQPFNLDEELVKITGGAVKSKDDIAALIANANKAQELETRLKTFEQENTTLKTKADADPFANDFTKKLNELYRAGANESQIQAFMTINKVTDIDTLKPIDASALALQVKFGLTPEEAKTYLSEKYKIDLDDPTAVLDKNAEIALKIDSTADREFLKTHKAEVSQVPVNQAAQDEEKQQQLLQQQYTEQLTKLQPIAKTVVNDVLENAFKGISINGKTDEGAIRVDLPVSQESKANLEKAVADMVASNWDSLTPDAKGQEAIKTFARNVLILQNYEAQLIDVASKTEMRIRAEYANATPINRGEAAPQLGKTKQQERVDSVTKALQMAGEI